MEPEQFDDTLDKYLEGDLPANTLGFHLVYLPDEGSAIVETVTTETELAQRAVMMRQLGPGQLLLFLGRRIWTSRRAEHVLLPTGPVPLTAPAMIEIDPDGEV